MFDKYMICDEAPTNVTRNGEVTGFQFGARLPYYRGLGLSMVERVDVTLDGAQIPAERVSLGLRGKVWPIAALETEYEERWEMGEVAAVIVELPGGLARGAHRIELLEQLRVSYLPFPLIGKDAKTFDL